MNDFSKVRFKGTFRDYQARVLQNANTHLKDGKIHIVAAPGSGKTILGLELIRGLNAPALVLSPSVTIRQQWGERFTSSFLPDGENGDGDYQDDYRPALLAKHRAAPAALPGRHGTGGCIFFGIAVHSFTVSV